MADARAARSACGKCDKAVSDVLLHRQMGKQGEALKHVSDAPLCHGKIDALRGVEQDAVADGDAS